MSNRFAMYPTKEAASPCLDCGDRHEACHDSCGRFAEFRKRIGALREAAARHVRIDSYGIPPRRKGGSR